VAGKRRKGNVYYMAVLQTIRNFLGSQQIVEPEIIVPAPMTVYKVRPLKKDNLPEVLRLNLRCFRNGENYTKHTFAYLFNAPNTLSYRVVTPSDETVGFVFVMINQNGSGHLTTIGVAPEHRRRGIAEMLLNQVDLALRNRNVSTVVLEVRVSNNAAQKLYRGSGYTVVQRIENYYVNGEACYLMMKPLV
jgi:ribosomal-protein-alanine N-acetyltransferase